MMIFPATSTSMHSHILRSYHFPLPMNIKNSQTCGFQVAKWTCFLWNHVCMLATVFNAKNFKYFSPASLQPPFQVLLALPSISYTCTGILLPMHCSLQVRQRYNRVGHWVLELIYKLSVDNPRSSLDCWSICRHCWQTYTCTCMCYWSFLSLQAALASEAQHWA